MRGFGIAALLSALAAFVLWMAAWVYWNFLLAELGPQSGIRYAAMASGVLSAFFQLLAIALLSVGLIVAAKRMPRG